MNRILLKRPVIPVVSRPVSLSSQLFWREKKGRFNVANWSSLEKVAKDLENTTADPKAKYRIIGFYLGTFIFACFMAEYWLVDGKSRMSNTTYSDKFDSWEKIKNKNPYGKEPELVEVFLAWIF